MGLGETYNVWKLDWDETWESFELAEVEGVEIVYF